MKTFKLVTIATLLSSSLLLPLTANAEESIESVNSEINASEKTFSYVIDGVEINSDVALNELELVDLYKSANKSNNGISTFQNDIGSNAITVVPIKRTHYKNAGIQVATDLFVEYIGSKIPVKSKKSVFASYLYSKLSSYVTGSKDTYVETYVTRAWSEYDQMYIFKATVCHYTDNTYKTLKTVNYREINRSKTKVLSGVNGYEK